MIRASILFFCIIISSPVILAQGYPTAGPAATPVEFMANGKDFPCKWRKKRINPQFTVLPAGEVERTLQVLDQALDKYPPETLEANLGKVFVLQTLRFFGLDYGGTYFKRNVYIANNGIEHGYSGKFIEGTFHHEFSSVLLKRHASRSLRQAWMLANPDGFSYGDGGVEALRSNATGLHLEDTLFHQGFLNEYSLASFEEDWNCYAEYIFLNDDGFWKAWEESEAIRAKTAILIGFYNALDPKFTLEYFMGL